jgi:hypothetical protein
MPQNTTLPRLTAQQERVLEPLLAGETVTAAAELVGVDRSTVHRWLREDSHFQAAYNQRRRELQQAHRSRLLVMVGAAINTVQHAVETGDVRVALKVLDSLGILSPIAVGADDVAQIEKTAEWAELAAARQQQDLELQRLLVSLSS